ncbi:MAG: family 20 glycosylhydrolase, partial [Planctomycetota bacterium]
CNLLMPYTEDTYEIPGEPRFGFQRGRYTLDELRRIDATAARLGIEVVGCIQTLGHLEQITRWPEYRAICDHESTILEGDPQTYVLIGKMLDAIASSVRSRRIHVGMDEAWSLGRGKHLDRHGGQPRFDILTRHLQKVVAMCRERGLSPMVWSDMWFNIGSPSHSYYDPKTVIPDAVAQAIPRELTLVYWDYYHADPAFYHDWIARHRAMGFEPSMASGVHTWARLWWDRADTESLAGACITAARAEKLEEIFFTMWGDDGAYCDFDSGLAGLAWCSERCFAPERHDAQLAARFQAVCGAAYAPIAQIGELGSTGIPPLLWDDPLLGLYVGDGSERKDKVTKARSTLATIATFLAGVPVETGGGDLNHARLLATVIAAKLAVRAHLEIAYASRDRIGLAAVRNEALALVPMIDDLAASWRRGWMRRNKPQGWEVLQLRLAQQAERHRELARRIDELLNGEAQTIPELDERCDGTSTLWGGWRALASGSVSV